MSKRIAAKPSKKCVSRVSVSDSPAVPNPRSANVDNEEESCHIVKKRRFFDGSGEATKRDVVEAIVRQHRVHNAPYPPTVAYSDSEPSWFTEFKKEVTSNFKHLKSMVKKQGIQQRVYNYNTRAAKANRNIDVERLIMPLNKRGKQPTRGPKTKAALKVLDKATIMNLEKFYDADFQLKKRDSVVAWRDALKTFLIQVPIPPSEADDDEDESEEENDEYAPTKKDAKKKESAKKRGRKDDVAENDESSQDDDEDDVEDEEEDDVYEDIPQPKKTTRKQVGKVDDDY